MWGDWQQTHPNDDKVANELQFHAEAGSFTKGLLGYIVNNLLTNATFDVLPQFVSILVRIRDVLPTFVGTLADVVIQLSQIKLDSQDEVDTSKLKLEEMSLWQKSALLNQFLGKRWLLKFERVRLDVGALAAERVRVINELRLCKGSAPADKMASMEVARTLLGPLSLGSKMQYLLKDPARFDMWAEWQPGHASLTGKKWAVTENSFQGSTARLFIHASLQIIGDDVDCSSDVAQPVAKDLVVTFKKLLTVTEGNTTYSFLSDKLLYGVVKALYAELAWLKLSVIPDLPELDLTNATADSNLAARCVKNVAKVLGAQLKKLNGPAAVWVKGQIGQVEQEAPVEPAAVAAPAAEGHGGTCATEVTKQPVGDDGFVLGALVVTTSGTNKDKHDQKKAEIVKGGSRLLVKFLEGPAKGITKEFAKNKLKLLEEEAPGSSSTQLVPAAGTAKGTDAEAKAARAAALFGKPATS